MIRVNVFKDSDGSCRGISFHGHAGYDDYGKDIICASVSALALNMANSVETFTEDGFNGSMDEESGAFEFSFTGQSAQSRSSLWIPLFWDFRIFRKPMENNILKSGLRRCK